MGPQALKPKPSNNKPQMLVSNNKPQCRFPEMPLSTVHVWLHGDHPPRLVSLHDSTYLALSVGEPDQRRIPVFVESWWFPGVECDVEGVKECGMRSIRSPMRENQKRPARGRSQLNNDNLKAKRGMPRAALTRTR